MTAHITAPLIAALLLAVAASTSAEETVDEQPASTAAQPAKADGTGRDTTVKILAPWEGSGHVYQIGPDTLQFLGAYEGVMYIETGEGMLDLAIFTCPARTNIRQFEDEIRAEGHCVMTSSDGELAFARFTCVGAQDMCRGEFVLTGGTGRLEGIEGGSELIVRTALSSMVDDQETGALISSVEGLAVWPELKVHLPNWPADEVSAGSEMPR